jgi:hypothetical protein
MWCFAVHVAQQLHRTRWTPAVPGWPLGIRWVEVRERVAVLLAMPRRGRCCHLTPLNIIISFAIIHIKYNKERLNVVNDSTTYGYPCQWNAPRPEDALAAATQSGHGVVNALKNVHVVVRRLQGKPLPCVCVLHKHDILE